MKKMHIVGLLFLSLWACKKQPPIDDTFTLPLGQGGFIINEGNFMWSNASLDYWDLDKDTIYRSIYQTVHPEVLGDVFQSLYLDGSMAWIVLNNSGKVVAINTRTLEKEVQITGLTAPRYVLPVSDHVFVTDIFNDKVSVANRSTGSIEAELPMAGWTEEMMVVNEQVWITNTASNYLAIVDVATLTVVDSIFTQFGPTFLEKDAMGRIWVLCTGNSNEPPALQAFISGQDQPEIDFTFPFGPAPSNLEINRDGNQLYYTYDGGVYSLSVTDQQLPDQPIISLSTQSLYGMEIDPYDRGIWILDALNYTQPGTITEYNLQGDSLRTVTAGLIPNGMEFR